MAWLWQLPGGFVAEAAAQCARGGRSYPLSRLPAFQQTSRPVEDLLSVDGLQALFHFLGLLQPQPGLDVAGI